MALNLIIFGGTKKIDQRTEESRFDDRRLVRRVNGNISYTCDGREDKWEVRRLQETEERRQTTCSYDVELVAFV